MFPLRVPPLATEPMSSLFAVVSTSARSSWNQDQPPLSLNVMRLAVGGPEGIWHVTVVSGVPRSAAVPHAATIESTDSPANAFLMARILRKRIMVGRIDAS